MNGERDQWDDWMMLVGIGLVVLFAGGGAAIASTVFPQLQEWALGANLLVTGDEVLIPVADGVGLDLPRLVLALALTLFLVAVLVVVVVRLANRQQSRGRRS